jgi:serine/threonine protein kinase
MSVLSQIYHAKEPPAFPQNINSELKDFLGCCLKIEPKERWNVFQLLRHPFITGDVFTFHNTGQFLEKNIEFDNKYFSEERNTR